MCVKSLDKTQGSIRPPQSPEPPRAGPGSGPGGAPRAPLQVFLIAAASPPARPGRVTRITARGTDSSALPDLAPLHPPGRAARKIVPGGVIRAAGAERGRVYKGREGDVWRSCSCLGVRVWFAVGLVCEPRGESCAAWPGRASARRAEGRASCGGGRVSARPGWPGERCACVLRRKGLGEMAGCGWVVPLGRSHSFPSSGSTASRLRRRRREAATGRQNGGRARAAAPQDGGGREGEGGGWRRLRRGCGRPLHREVTERERGPSSAVSAAPGEPGSCRWALLRRE